MGKLTAAKLCALSCLWLAATCTSASAQDRPALRQEISQHLEFIFQGNYAEASKRFGELSAKYPAHPAGDFYQAVTLTWQSYVDGKLDTGKRGFDVQINDLLDTTIRKAEALKARVGKSVGEESEALFFLGSAYAMRSRLNVLQNHALPAARFARTGQDHLNALIKLTPDDADAYFSAGSIFYRVGLLTDSPLGRAASSLLGAKSLPVGDRQQGVSYLKRAAENGQHTSVDAKLALLEIYTLIENQFAEALPIAANLQTKYPDNQTFARYLLRIYLGLKDKAKLTQTARQIIANVKAGKPNFGVFMQAEAEKHLAEAKSL